MFGRFFSIPPRSSHFVRQCCFRSTSSSCSSFFGVHSQNRFLKKRGYTTPPDDLPIFEHELPFSVDASKNLEKEKKKPGYGLVVLNCPIGELFPSIWDSASLHVCADGGANRLFNYDLKDRPIPVPDYIIGDMDSIRVDVAQYYQTHGSKCIPIQDEHTTDLEKAVIFISQLPLKSIETAKGEIPGIGNLIAYGAFWGRFDHQISACHSLYRYSSLFPQMMLISESNCGFLLSPGKHIIRCCPHLQPPGTYCGLFPLGEPVERVWTTGLRYNLTGEGLRMGGLVSTSNQIHEREVSIVTSHPLFWWSGLGLGDHCEGWVFEGEGKDKF